MNKNTKSRIPVRVTDQKSSKLCSKESLEMKSYLVKKQTLSANRTTKVHLMQKKIEKINPHPENSKHLKDINRYLDLKNKSSSLKTNIKCNSTSTNNNNTLEKSIRTNINKLRSCQAKIKSNPTNKANTNINVDSKILSSVDTELKSNSAEDKKENLPSPICYNFEEEVCTPIPNRIKSEQECFSECENVEFEANEIYRKMILSNRELSPSVRKLMPNLRLSSLQSLRPSVYQKAQISDDPLKEALKALENTCLSVKRIKKETKLAQSPRRDTFRDSIYTPAGDPNKEFLKKLEDFKLKQLQKTAPRSTKKVTFNLDIRECTPRNACDIKQDTVKNSDHRLLQINEKSEESTPNSPYSVKNEENKLSDISTKNDHNTNQTISIGERDSPTKTDYKDGVYSECNKIIIDKNDTTSESNQKTVYSTTPDKSASQNRETSVLILKEIYPKNSSSAITCDNEKVEKYTDCSNTNNIYPSDQKRIKQGSKIYTPKPISLSSKSAMRESYSPEFLVDRKSVIMTDLAPICTPLVLKNQAKNTMFSPETDQGPIPLKLNFEEMEKDTPKKESSRRHTLSASNNILTYKAQLEYLADQECYLLLIHENFPVSCGRYLTNPVARTLSEGDDMHFIPIRL